MIPLLFAAALLLPVPASPPIPVSSPVFSAAPFNQDGVRVATNGSIALAVWNDQRNGRSEVTASRITSDGTPLDPLGIVIRTGLQVQDVFWNGVAFAVLTGPGRLGSTDYEFAISYVSPEGEVTEGDSLSPGLMPYAARTGEGADARFLFLPTDGLPVYARVVDIHGDVIRAGEHHYAEVTSVIAAGSVSGFLEIRGISPNPFVAYSLDRDGKVLRSTELQVPASFESAALTADGGGGYALFGAVRASNELILIRLDGSGAAVGHPQWIQSGDLYDWYRDFHPVTAAATSDGFVASWLNSDGRAYVSRNGAAPVMTLDCGCRGADAVYDRADDLLIASYDDTVTSSGTDVFVQKGSARPILVTHAAQLQTNAAIAAGSNGFLVAWWENGQIYVRRYGPDARPMEDARLADAAGARFAASYGGVSIISSGDVYLVMWEGSYGRRMDARSGEWIDPQAFAMPSIVAATNGTDALALGSGSVSRFSIRGSIAMSEPVNLSGFPITGPPAIASNGDEYLAVWEECPSCTLFVGPAERRIVASRLSSTGIPIDVVPIVLYPAAPSDARLAVAWNGSTYLVTWSNYGALSGVYFGSDGVVHDLGYISRFHPGMRSMKIVVQAGEFLILTHELDALRLSTVDGSSTTIATRPSEVFGPMDGASDGAHLMLAYDRVDDAAGRVGRVVIDPRVSPSRKRAVR